jgi:prepilin-type N-terminal cleavage/methylation domain-containing protein
MNKTQFKNKKGFTLVETLVAISILMLAILGPLSIASTGLQNVYFARDQITAYYLAQEGIEYAREIRDDNYITYTRSNPLLAWDTILKNCEPQQAPYPYGCRIDMPRFFNIYSESNPASLVACSSLADCTIPLYEDSNGYYTYNTNAPGAVASIFKRYVKITPNGSNPNDLNVQSTVIWQTGSQPQKTFTIAEDIYNIY